MGVIISLAILVAMVVTVLVYALIVEIKKDYEKVK